MTFADAPDVTVDLERAVTRLLAEREAQGLPRHVFDPVALAAVAEVLLTANAKNATASTSAASNRRNGGVRSTDELQPAV
jgi:hypothetical protein